MGVKVGSASIVGLIMCLFMIAFGMFWTMMAASLGAPIWFFGLFFVAIGVVILVSNIRELVAFRRAPKQVGSVSDSRTPYDSDYYGSDSMRGSDFCPYCGARAGLDFEYCKKCGRKIS